MSDQMMQQYFMGSVCCVVGISSDDTEDCRIGAYFDWSVDPAGDSDYRGISIRSWLLLKKTE
jgi:hypothetical protein